MSAYLLAKVRGKLSRMLTPADIAGLEGSRIEAIIERLKATSYAEPLKAAGGEGLSDLLRAGLFTDISDLLFSLEGEDRRLVCDILARYRVENLKTVVRAKLRGLPEGRVEGMILNLPWEKIDYNRIIGLPTLEAAIHAVPWPRYRIRLEGVYRQIGETESPFAYEAAVDNVYIETLITHYKRREESIKEILKNRLLREIICWAFRLKGYGHSFPEIINILPDFRPLISQPELRAIVEDDGGWRRIARSLDRESAPELDRVEGFSPRPIEAMFGRQLIRLTRRELILNPLGFGVIVGYVYMKEIELGRLIEAVEKARRGT